MTKTQNTLKSDIYISVVFPNWNKADSAVKYIKSIYKSNIPKKQIEITMVDNNSTDNSAELVQKKYPDVKIIRLDKNYGPAYARNQGIKHARGEVIFCSDNDQVLKPETLDFLIKKLSKNNTIGIVGAKVVSIEDKKTIIACGYKFNKWLGKENGLSNCHLNKEVDWIPGCCMMFRKTLTEEIGLFDEKFTFFGEDADFGLRVKKAGLKVISLPNAVVYHPESKKKQFSREMYINYYKSKFRLINKHCSFMQKCVAFGLHMTILSLIRYIKGKPEYWSLKWQALKKR